MGPVHSDKSVGMISRLCRRFGPLRPFSCVLHPFTSLNFSARLHSQLTWTSGRELETASNKKLFEAVGLKNSSMPLIKWSPGIAICKHENLIFEGAVTRTAGNSPVLVFGLSYVVFISYVNRARSIWSPWSKNNTFLKCSRLHSHCKDEQDGNLVCTPGLKSESIGDAYWPPCLAWVLQPRYPHQFERRLSPLNHPFKYLWRGS